MPLHLPKSPRARLGQLIGSRGTTRSGDQIRDSVAEGQASCDTAPLPSAGWADSDRWVHWPKELLLKAAEWGARRASIIVRR